nr:MAG TPA: hypothetical protein [Caudoviricetes sp.]DAQ91200.1 MAG TPA: hypothetical protein [Caudoviricetes sp.]
MSYSVLCCHILSYSLLSCDTFHVTYPIFNFYLDEPLCRRYKSHMLCSVLCCSVLHCSDDLYRLQNSPSVKCCVYYSVLLFPVVRIFVL